MNPARFSWLTRCLEGGMIEEHSDLQTVIDRLYFPLCGLELTERRVLDEVNERREEAWRHYWPF